MKFDLIGFYFCVVVQADHLRVDERLGDVARAAAVEHGPRLRVDVRQRQVDVPLGVGGEQRPLGEHLPELDVVLLYLPLLAGVARVAVEQAAEPLARPRVEFDPPGVGELAPVVGQDAAERLRVELVAEPRPDGVEGPAHLLRRLPRELEREHEVGLPEQQRQQAGRVPPPAQHRVHLDDLDAGVIAHERDEVVVGAAREEGQVGRLARPLPIGLRVFYPLRQVDVHQAGYQPLVDELQDGRVGPPDLGPVRLEYLGQGLVHPLDERDQDRREPAQLLRVGVDAPPRLAPPRLDAPPDLLRVIDVFAEPAPLLPGAAVAHVWEFPDPRAVRRLGELGARVVAVAPAAGAGLGLAVHR